MRPCQNTQELGTRGQSMQRENSSLLQGHEGRRALKRPTGPAGSAMPEVPSQLSQHGASSSWKSRRVSSACSASERSAWLLGSAPPSQQPPGRGPGSWHAGSWSAWHLSAGQRGTGGCFSTSLSGPEPAPSSCSAERRTEAPTPTWRAWGARASAARSSLLSANVVAEPPPQMREDSADGCAACGAE